MLDEQADPALPGRWRRSLGDWVEAAGGGPELVEVIVLAVSEALSNAVEHAYRATPGSVRLRATLTLPTAPPTPTADLSTSPGTGALTRIEVDVTDRGSWQPPTSGPGRRGRGLATIRATAEDVDLTATAEGTTVRMTWTLPNPA